MDGLDRAHRDHGAGSGPVPSLEQWANLLRVLDQDGAERRELPKLLRLSRRAVRSNVSVAERKGWGPARSSPGGYVPLGQHQPGGGAAGVWDVTPDHADVFKLVRQG